jgi:hypothetical protein
MAKVVVAAPQHEEIEETRNRTFTLPKDLDIVIETTAKQLGYGDWSKFVRHVLDVVTSDEEFLKKIILSRLDLGKK